MSQSQTVLEAVLKQNIDAPYSCQGGICSSCIARVKEGEITMVKNQILTDGEVAEGLILTCQSHPTSTKMLSLITMMFKRWFSQDLLYLYLQ